MMPTAILLNAFHHLYTRPWICKVGRSDRYGGSPREKKFHRITSGHDTAHPDDGQFHTLMNFPNQSQREGLDGRARQPSLHAGNSRPPRFCVNRYPRKRIGNGQAVSAPPGGSVPDGDDICDIRREFYQQRLSRHPPDPPGHLLR